MIEPNNSGSMSGPDAPSEPPNTFKQVVVGVLAQRYSPIHRQTEEILAAHEADKARAVREARHELLNRFATSYTYGWVLKELDELEPD